LLNLQDLTGHWKHTEKKVQNWRKADRNGMRVQTGKVNWRKELRGNTTEIWGCSKGKVHTVHQASDKNVPWKELKGRERPVWMQPEVIIVIRRKKKLWPKVKGKK
jgi:hypothetical protein